MINHLRTVRRVVVSVVSAWALLAAAPGYALADSASASGDELVAQTLGDRELTVVLRRVTSVPGPLRIDVITHDGTAAGHLTVALTPVGASSAAPRSAPGVPVAESGVDLGARPGTYGATATVDRPGPWELALGDGQRTTRIPFLVPAQVTSPPERLVYVGFLTAGILLLVSAVVAARAAQAGWALLPAGGAVVCLSVAVTAAVLSASQPLPPQPGLQVDPTIDDVTNMYASNKPLVSDYSRPPVTMTLQGTPLPTGAPGDVTLNLSDGATGLPVDDLVIHGGALIHFLMVGPTGQLWHLHPIRVAPGRYQQHLVLPMPGHYALSAELARRGGGVQLVRVTGVDAQGVAARPTAPMPDPVVLGGASNTEVVRLVGAAPSVVTATTAPRAGVPVTVTAHIGGPADLQPWLGMVGHMIVAGPLPASHTTEVGTGVTDAPVWAHTHSMGGMPAATMMTDGATDPMLTLNPVNGDSAPDETVAGYGPDVPFTFTFPVAGRYRLWLQVERNFRILTLPILLDVAAAPGESSRR